MTLNVGFHTFIKGKAGGTRALWHPRGPAGWSGCDCCRGFPSVVAQRCSLISQVDF